ncbi:MAG: hypothetical protein WBF99_11590 [Xanthobacteraceae bacterium]
MPLGWIEKVWESTPARTTGARSDLPARSTLFTGSPTNAGAAAVATIGDRTSQAGNSPPIAKGAAATVNAAAITALWTENI